MPLQDNREYEPNYAFTAARVHALLEMAADAVSPSDRVSSRIKGELLALLCMLQREVPLRMLAEEA